MKVKVSVAPTATVPVKVSVTKAPPSIL